MQRWRHLRKKYSNLHSFHIRNPNPCVDWIEERNIFTKRKLKWHIYQLCWPLYLFSERIRRMQDILKEITVPTRSISHYVATSPFVDLLSYIHHHGPKNRTTWSRTEKVAQHTFPSPPWTTLKLKLNAIVGVKF